MAFAPNGRARLPLSPPEGGLLTTRQASLNAADRLVAPPEGLLTLGFDPTRFQTEPPACYRASWQLPGRDSHPLATTSLCWITIYISTSNSGRTRGKYLHARLVHQLDDQIASALQQRRQDVTALLGSDPQQGFAQLEQRDVNRRGGARDTTQC